MPVNFGGLTALGQGGMYAQPGGQGFDALMQQAFPQQAAPMMPPANVASMPGYRAGRDGGYRIGGNRFDASGQILREDPGVFNRFHRNLWRGGRRGGQGGGQGGGGVPAGIPGFLSGLFDFDALRNIDMNSLASNPQPALDALGPFGWLLGQVGQNWQTPQGSGAGRPSGMWR